MPHVWVCPWRPAEDLGATGTEITGSCEQPDMSAQI